MPSIYTHFRFGQLAYEEMPTAVKMQVASARPQYTLGLQGPDFFYYSAILRRKGAQELGDYLHEQSLRDSLEMVFAQNNAQVGKKWGALDNALLSYLHGFLAHFTLDSICHPLIHNRCPESSIHVALETELDAVLLREEGLRPFTYSFAELCPADSDVLDTAEKFYSPWADRLRRGGIRRAVKDCRMIREWIYTPTLPHFRLLSGTMNVLGLLSSFGGILQSPENKPVLALPEDSDKIIEELLDLMELALIQYRENTSALRARLEEGKELPEFFARNFSMQGKPWEGESEEEEEDEDEYEYCDERQAD